MIRNGEGALEAAASRLHRAVETLERRIENLSPAEAPSSEADEALRADLRSARERERALEAAAAEASTTLGRAADQIRAALAEEAGAGHEEETDPGRPVYETEPSPEEAPDLDSLSDDLTDLHQPRFSYRNEGA
jgi:chromosome segregation ATPase